MIFRWNPCYKGHGDQALWQKVLEKIETSEMPLRAAQPVGTGEKQLPSGNPRQQYDVDGRGFPRLQTLITNSSRRDCRRLDSANLTICGVDVDYPGVEISDFGLFKHRIGADDDQVTG